MLKQQFAGILAELSQIYGEDLDLDPETSTASLLIDDLYMVNLTYLEQSDFILLYCPVGGYFPEEDTDGAQAEAFLRLCDLDGAAAPMTLMHDAEGEVLLAADRRSALEINSIDALTAWIDQLINAVRATREYYVSHFGEEEVSHE